MSRWVAGEVVPQRLNKERLLELAYVAEAVTEVLPADHANVWMFMSNRQLGHRKPADLIRDGQFQEVLALIDAMAEGWPITNDRGTDFDLTRVDQPSNPTTARPAMPSVAPMCC